MGAQRFTVLILGAGSCLDWDWVRRKVSVDGSIWKRKELGLQRHEDAQGPDWLQPSGGTALSIRLFSISLLVGFLLSRLKALTMALNRFTSFSFFNPEKWYLWVPVSTTICLILSVTPTVILIFYWYLFLYCALPAMECYVPWKRNCDTFPLLGPWCTAQCLTHNWLLIVC